MLALFAIDASFQRLSRLSFVAKKKQTNKPTFVFFKWYFELNSAIKCYKLLENWRGFCFIKIDDRVES